MKYNNLTLVAIEKACRKIEKAIASYNQLAGNPHRLVEVNRAYYSKAIALYKKLEAEHSFIMEQIYFNETVVNRANEMLKNAEINKIYQSFATKDDAQNWLVKTAIATLIVPISQRKSA